MPHLVGFLGRYWMKDNLPLKPTITSLIDNSLCGVPESWQEGDQAVVGFCTEDRDLAAPLECSGSCRSGGRT